MIPKIIHYCWFGNKTKSELVIKCILTWRKYMQDFEIIEWNEQNCDIEAAPNFVKEAYKSKKWAFVSDYFRLKALYEFGGIYLDTDVEIKRKMDNLLNNQLFMCFERKGYLCTAVIGAEKNQKDIFTFMNSYNEKEFNEIPNSKLMYDFLISNDNVNISKEYVGQSYIIYPIDYFSPKDFYTGKLNITQQTYAIHHFDGTWKSSKQKSKDKISKILYKLLGQKKFQRLRDFFKKD